MLDHAMLTASKPCFPKIYEFPHRELQPSGASAVGTRRSDTLGRLSCLSLRLPVRSTTGSFPVPLMACTKYTCGPLPFGWSYRVRRALRSAGWLAQRHIKRIWYRSGYLADPTTSTYFSTKRDEQSIPSAPIRLRTTPSFPIQHFLSASFP